MKISFEKKFFLLFILIAFVLVSLGVLLYSKARKDINNSNLMAHTEQVLVASEQVLYTLKDFESASRGYVITGDTAYVPSYPTVKASLDKHLATLVALTLRDPVQKLWADSLKYLAVSRLGLSRITIELNNDKGTAAAKAWIIGGQGAARMEQVNNLIARMQEKANITLIRLGQISIKSDRAFKNTFYLLLLIMLVFLVTVFFIIRNHILYRKKAEQELFLTNEWYHQTLASLGDGVITTDANAAITFLNRAAEELTGWEQADAAGRAIGEVFHPIHGQTGNAVANPLREALLQNKTIWLAGNSILVKKDDRRLFIDDSAAPVHDKNGTIKGGVLIFRDITERKKAEDEIMQMNKELEGRVEQRTNEVIEKEKKYRVTLDNMMEGVQIMDFDWRYIYVNDAAAQHNRYAKEELLNHSLLEKYPGIQTTGLFSVLKLCMDERRAQALEYEFVYPDNTRNWFKLSMEPVPEGLFILSIDITGHKKAEQEKQDYFKSLEEMLFIISHKLRVPVANIMGLSNQLDDPFESQEELKQIAGYMKDSVLLMDKFTRELNLFVSAAKQKQHLAAQVDHE